MQRRVFICFMFFLVAVLFSACGEKIGPGTTSPEEVVAVAAPVVTAKVTQQPFIYEAVGTVTARTASTISSKLMGTVREVHVQEGDRIRKGDLLVTLDPRQVKANLDRALANAGVAEKEYNRYKQLIKTQSASQQEYDRAEAQHRQAQAAVAAARVSRKDAQIRAPYDGRVVAKMIDRGDLASPGTPFLSLEQEGQFWADLVLPERHIQAVEIGLTVNIVVPALDNRVFTGEVGRIIPMADARSRSFQVKVHMPAGKALKSGMFARVAIPLGGTGMLLVPKSAVVEQGHLDGLYIVDDSRLARFRLVRTGKHFNNQVEVISGLNVGQQFVSEVSPAVKDGIKVK